MHLHRLHEKGSLRPGTLLLALMFSLFATPGMSLAGPEKLSADAIAEEANIAAYYPGDDSRARVHLSITNARGKVR